MSLFPCSRCGMRSKGRLAQAYWAWFEGGSDRVAMKERLCRDCAKDALEGLLETAKQNSTHVSMCPGCGEDSASHQDPIYLTLYLPKREALEWALPTCANCASTIRQGITQNGEKLPDRQGSSGGLGPQTDDGWGTIGVPA